MLSFAIAGLQRRLLLLWAVAMLPVFGLVIASSFINQRASLAQAGDNLLTVARLSALDAYRSVEGARQILNAVTSSPSLKGPESNVQCSEFLANIHQSYRYYNNVGFLDTDGKLVCNAVGAQPLSTYGDRSYLQQALATRAFAMGDYQIGRITGKPSINFAMPVDDNGGALKGVAFVSLDLRRLAPGAGASPGFPYSVSVTDRHGTVLGSNQLPADRIGQPYPDQALAAAIKELPASIITAVDPEGASKMYAVSAVSDDTRHGLFVVASIARETVTAPLQRKLMLQLGVLLLVTAGGILAARWTANRILVSPARQLLNNLQELAGDSPAAATPVNVDEITELSSAFERVASVLAERERRYREAQALLDMASRISRVGAWQVGLPDYRLTWSDEVCAIHELPCGTVPSVEDAIGFYAPEYRSVIQELVGNCARLGTPFDAEVQLITARQRRIWVRALGEAKRDASGAIVCIQGAFQDIDAQKQAEAKALALAGRLTTTLESISDAFFLLDKDWNFVFLNGQAESVLKRGRAGLLGRTIWQEFPEAIGTPFEQHYRDAVLTNRTSRFEAFFGPLDAWFEVNAYPTDDGLAVYFQEVTERRRAARQLRLLESAVSRLNDMVVITEASPVSEPGPLIVFVNDAFERLTGYSRADVIGKSPRLLQGPKTERAELDRIRASLEQSEPVRAEVINYTKSRQGYWVEMDIVPLADENGAFTHFVAVQRVITERKLAERKILMLNATLEERVLERTLQLEAANEELEAFSYSVSHDLRSPLNTIDGFSFMLQKKDQQLDDKARHYLTRIRSGVKQMGELIEGLLSLAQLGRCPLHRKELDLSALCHRVVQECRDHEPGRDVHVSIQDGMRVVADPTLLLVVMQNLIGNAWKYTSRRDLARIEVAWEAVPGGEVAYVVRDNGAGFDMAYAGKLFQTFQRLHASSSFPGNGVGLANVKRVVERHGGRVWAQGQVEEGASFYFTLGNRTEIKSESGVALQQAG